MLRIDVNTNKGAELVEIKTSYREFLYKDFVSIERNSSIQSEHLRTLKNIQDLSGSDLVLQFDDFSLQKIKPHLNFIDEPILLIKSVPETVANINIGDKSWSMLEASKMHIKNSVNGLLTVSESLANVAQIYTGIDIMNMPFEDARPIAIYFRNQLETFFAKYKKLTEYKPTKEQVQAGISRFEKYGFFTTLHALAKGDLLKYDSILDQKASVVYQTLVIDYENSDYAKQLAEAHKPTKAA
jgi:hypothetical protein